MREQFESDLTNYYKSLGIIRPPNFSGKEFVSERNSEWVYDNEYVNSAFIGWQASRACLEVELPKEGRDGLVDWNAVVEKLEAQGIKVKV